MRFRAEHDFKYPADELGANHTDIELAVWNADGRTKLISKVRMRQTSRFYVYYQFYRRRSVR